jgi:1-acyl-sn-glycerol-3-phosphate acyltransferase
MVSFSLESEEVPGSVWPAQKSAWAKSFEFFCRSVFRLYCPLKVYGKEHLPKAPFMICSNHASHMDSTMLMVAAGFSFQKVGLIAAKDYFFDQSHRFYLHYMLNLVPIARGSGTRSIKDSAQACASFLKSGGQALIIYPEGTRSQTRKIAPFKQGAAILAYELKIPMIPAFVGGSANRLPKGSYFIKPGGLTVRFGEPLNIADWLSHDEKNDRRAQFLAYRECTAELEKRVRALAEKGM